MAGIDLGLKRLATIASADGSVRVVDNPHHLNAHVQRLRFLNRQLARRQRGSAGWQHTRRRLSTMHARIANLRENSLHHLTTSLVRDFDVLGVESLPVSALGRGGNRGLRRSIADAAWGELYRQLDYKAAQAGKLVIRADRFYPSSKTCSSCGAVKAKLLLSEREYVCEVCGVVIDRDDNAALNLCRVAETALSAGVDSGGGSVRPDLRPAVPGEAATIERWSDTSQGVSAR